MKKLIFRFWPFIFICGLWFVFSAPYFFQQKLPYPAKYQVSFFTPWNAYPEYGLPIKNNALSDVVVQLYPWKHFTIEELQKGNLPLWNPYSFSGNPHLANYQTAVFSPFNLLFFVLPFIDSWSLIVLLQPFLAALFTYLFMRSLRVSHTGSVIASIAFMFCGFITVWMAYGTLAMAVTFLPLSFFAIEKIFKKTSFVSLLLLSVSLILSFFSGHFQMSLYVACYVFAYILFSFFRSKNTKALFFTLAAYAAGISISLFQILPSLEFYKLAVRSELFSNADGIPWYYLVTVFAPDFFGNPVTRNDWLGHYAEWASFIGVIPFMLAIFSLFLKKQKKLIFFFFFGGLVTLLLAIDSPLQYLLSMSKIPIFSTSIPSRIIILFSFSFIILAGFGFDYLMEKIKQRSAKKLLLPFGISGLFLFIAWIVVYVPYFLAPDKIILAKRNLILPSFLFMLVAAVTYLAIFIKNKRIAMVIPLMVLLWVAGDSLRFAQKWIPFEERVFIYPTVPVIEAMQKNIGEGRVYGYFGAYIDTYYHIPSIEGYDPLYNKRYGELLQSAKTGSFAPAIRSLAKLEPTGKYTQRVLDILGVTVIYQPIAHSRQSFAFPVWNHPENFPTLYRDDKFALFKNTTAMPRVKLFSQYEVIADQKQLLQRLFTDDFDYKNILLLEEDPKITISDQQTGQAKITSYAPNTIIISVTSSHPALLFLSDNYYSLWKATVNGQAEKIFIADYTLRAVKVPKGKSTVEFSYSSLF